VAVAGQPLLANTVQIPAAAASHHLFANQEASQGDTDGRLW
jgi:hypothetical protein